MAKVGLELPTLAPASEAQEMTLTLNTHILYSLIQLAVCIYQFSGQRLQ